MGNTSPSELAAELLRQCLQGTWQPALLEELVAEALHPDAERARLGGKALFAQVVEPLADQFDSKLCEIYAQLFSQVIETAAPGTRAEDLAARYRRVRQPRRFDLPESAVSRVFVLSRVTLGADVAITSVILDAVKRRFPEAQILFAGPTKSWELFAGDPRLSHLRVEYSRGGTLRERLAVWPGLREALSLPGSIVIDPDSRLTQLGLLEVCSEERYFFFESRAYGGTGSEGLTELTRRWVRETFQVEGAGPYLAFPPEVSPLASDAVALSFGVGENPAKGMGEDFEARLLQWLVGLKLPMVIDTGAGGEEARRVERALQRCGPAHAGVLIHRGAFTPFAATIAAGRLYVGYDSAGQHVAAAAATPLVTVFSGYPSHRMLMRWKPSGPGPTSVIPASNRRPENILEEVMAAVSRWLEFTRQLSAGLRP